MVCSENNHIEIDIWKPVLDYKAKLYRVTSFVLLQTFKSLNT